MSKLTALFVLFVPAAVFAQPTFAPHVDYGVGSTPQQIAIGDLNGDGRPDAVATNFQTRTVSVLLGAGSGTFAAPVAYPLAGTGGPEGVAVGDFNSDGRLDVVAVEGFPGKLTVLLGNGSGALGVGVDSAIPDGASVVTTGDLNEDGLLDVIALDQGGRVLTTALGDGTGAFPSVSSRTVGTTDFTLSPVVADINEDGHLDVALVNTTPGSVFILRGNGDGTYAAMDLEISMPMVTTSLVVADVNADGNLDLVAEGDSTVVTRLGNGNGTFGAVISSSHASSAVGEMRSGDFDLDGRLDLVLTDFDNDGLLVLLGNGSGAFAGGTTFAASGSPLSLAVADLNLDSRMDAVTLDNFNGVIDVFLNTTVVSSADLGVQLTATPRLGLLVPAIEFTVRATNNGPGSLTSATVTSSISPALAATSSTCTASPGSVSCPFGPLAPSATTTKTFRVPLGLLTLGLPITVTATRTASSPNDPNAANDSASRSCVVITPLLVLCN